MKRDAALRLLAKSVRTDDIVVAVYQTLFDWLEICPRDLNYVATGAMGQGSSHGLGLALANPERRVLVFDGDGSLLMNLGSLATVAGAAPCNLFHFVFANGTYEVNGSHPIPAADRIDFAAMALAAGYSTAEKWDSIDALNSGVQSFLGNPGPAFAELTVEPGRPYRRDYSYIHSYKARDAFRRALNAS
ncbi:MAG: thiamine pyrophosphate-binding protein [Rhodobacteraceae bacterium]|nr:thiamine pyrophosphate-binding protein [Paracoccaceae bacterium]